MKRERVGCWGCAAAVLVAVVVMAGAAWLLRPGIAAWRWGRAVELWRELWIPRGPRVAPPAKTNDDHDDGNDNDKWRRILKWKRGDK